MDFLRNGGQSVSILLLWDLTGQLTHNSSIFNSLNQQTEAGNGMQKLIGLQRNYGKQQMELRIIRIQ